MAIGTDSIKDDDKGREDRIKAFLKSEPVPAPDRDADDRKANAPAKPDLPPDSANKPSPPGFVDNG